MSWQSFNHFYDFLYSDYNFSVNEIFRELDGLLFYEFKFANRFPQNLTTADLRLLASVVLEKQPGLVFDVLMMHQDRHGALQLVGWSRVAQCTCGKCIEIRTGRANAVGN